MIFILCNIIVVFDSKKCHFIPNVTHDLKFFYQLIDVYKILTAYIIKYLSEFIEKKKMIYYFIKIVDILL